jgi:D-glycero-D-manno-heptose 1,7-bisphosphate phosphatase
LENKIFIDETWTLFLDRDGVINKKIPNGYVTDWEEFEFLPDVHTALRFFGHIFGKIVIVTNQQCVGKELITKDELNLIHEKMIAEIEDNGGRIDRVYFCPDLAEKKPPCRKPEVGMALWAKRDFPQIDFNKSIMVGDSLSDMRFGLSLGMESFFITSKEINPETGLVRVDSLYDVLSHLDF